MRGRLDATGERGGVRAPSRKIFAKKNSTDSCPARLLLPAASRPSVDGLISQTAQCYRMVNWRHEGSTDLLIALSKEIS